MSYFISQFNLLRWMHGIDFDVSMRQYRLRDQLHKRVSSTSGLPAMGQQFIDAIPHRFREAIVDKRITRLVKKAGQDPVFETIDDEAGVIKLAGRGAPLDVVTEFGVEAAREVIDIPIIGGFPTSAFTALGLCQRFGSRDAHSFQSTEMQIATVLRQDSSGIDLDRGEFRQLNGILIFQKLLGDFLC